jgi:hypothetical protein
MNHRTPTSRPILLLTTVLAIFAGIVYLAIAVGFVPDDFESPPPPVMLVAAVAYIAGGLAIPFVGRRLLLVGTVVNVVVLVLFVLSAVRGTGTVDALSLSGKLAQVALGVLLVWIVRQSDTEPGQAVTI